MHCGYTGTDHRFRRFNDTNLSTLTTAQSTRTFSRVFPLGIGIIGLSPMSYQSLRCSLGKSILLFFASFYWIDYRFINYPRESANPIRDLERHTGFEPVHSAWKADVLAVEHQCRILLLPVTSTKMPFVSDVFSVG